LIATSQITTVVLSAGGFNGKRFSNVIIPLLDEPKRSPDSTVKEKINVNQVMNFIFLSIQATIPNFSITINYFIFTMSLLGSCV